MDNKKVIEALQEQFKTELFYANVGVQSNQDPKNVENAKWYAVQRCLGMIELAQQLGVPYEVVEPMFQEIKEKIYKLEKTLDNPPPSII